AEIVEIQLGRLRQLLAAREVELQLTPAARDLVAEHGWNPQFGARPLKRAIQRHLTDPLARGFLTGEYQGGDRLEADVADGQLVFRCGKKPSEAA
ncbi:MAG: type VI secretion system ATPase TssH, partial [Pseudomonadota bacterium]